MSLPTNLFMDAPEMHDVSMHQLSQDIASWPQDIVQKLREVVPDTAGLSVQVKFMKKDEENGTATGSIEITSPDKKAVVPVIVKDFMMYPLDVMIANQKLLPFTPDYFQSIFSNNEIFDKIEEYPQFGGLGRFEDANLWNAIYPPSLGRYAYASGPYPMLEEIAQTIDGSSFKDIILGDEKVAAMFYRNGHRELIKKLAHLQPVNMNEFRQGVDNLVPKGVAMLRAEGPNKYNLVSSPDSRFHPGITTLDRDSCAKFLSKLCDKVHDDINDVDQNGEKLLRVPPPEDGVFLAGEDKDVIEKADSFDHYSLKGKTGVSFEGVVIPRVISFEQKPVDLKIFLGKNMSSIQPEFYGVRLKNSRFRPESQMPKAGQTGTFIYQPDESHALATIPVTIKSVFAHSIKGSQLIIEACDMMGAPYKLKMNNDMGLQQITRLPDGSYCLPGKMKWVPMEQMGALTDSAESYAVKTAATRMTNRPVTVIDTGYGQYSMRGVDKYAAAAGWDKTNMPSWQTKFLLSFMGAGEEKIARILKSAEARGHAEVHGLRFPPLHVEKVAEALPLAKAMQERADQFRSNLVKEASYMENSQTVDALLSLNFVNPENIAKFVGKLPHFKATISQLASCLIASRLGMKEIPEQAASTAMQRLIEVVNGLEGLRGTQEIGPG